MKCIYWDFFISSEGNTKALIIYKPILRGFPPPLHSPYSFNYVYDGNYAHRLVCAGDRYYKYDSNGNIICEQNGSFESNGEEVSYHKITQEADGVYSTDYGWGLFKEDDKGGSGKTNRTKY